MGNRTVLVTDDETSVRKLVGAILARDGYDILEARDGFEALQIAAKTPVDLVVADVVMPGMSGPELVLRMREQGAARRFLLISGYAGDALDMIHGIFDRVPFLQKPFTAERLLAKIREAFGAVSTLAIRAASPG